MRAYKTVNDTFIEPVSFIVPRRAEVFQTDIYPPCVGLKPAMSASEWLSGKDGLPAKISLESVYEGEAPKEVPSDYKPVAATPISPPATKTETTPPKKEEEPKMPAAAPAPVRSGPPPSMKDNQTSIANMASKFADQEDDDEDDDEEEEEFEEIQKPVDRSAVNAARAVETKPAPKEIHQPTPPKAAQPTDLPAPIPAPSATTSAAPAASSAGQSGGPGEVLRNHLQDIKSMIEMQSKQISALNSKVDALERKVGGGAGGAAGSSERERELAEKVRQLEMELEEARG